MKQGIPLQVETDEITPCQVIDNGNPSSDPSLDKPQVGGTEDQSDLHDLEDE